MQTTKKSISPRITDETLNPVLEDTPEMTTPVAPVKFSEPHVHSEHMDQFFAWKKRYGSTRFMVPYLNAKDKEPEFVGINGKKFLIDKGVFIDLPQNIADMLAEKFSINMNLGSNIEGQDMRIKGNNTTVHDGVTLADALS